MYGRKLDLKSKTRVSPKDLINVAAARADVHAEITSSSLQLPKNSGDEIIRGSRRRKLRKWRVVVIVWQEQRELDRL